MTHELGAGRGVYLYVIDGDVTVNGERMTTGDAAQITDEPPVAITPQPRASSSWSTSCCPEETARREIGVDAVA